MTARLLRSSRAPFTSISAEGPVATQGSRGRDSNSMPQYRYNSGSFHVTALQIMHAPEKISYDVEEASFDELVISRSMQHPVLLDIGAEWCGPCKVLTPRLEKLVHEYGGKFLLAKVDADENMRIAGRHRVRGFPTVIAYSRGQETDRFHSAQPDSFLRRFIDKLIAHHEATESAP